MATPMSIMVQKLNLDLVNGLDNAFGPLWCISDNGTYYVINGGSRIQAQKERITLHQNEERNNTAHNSITCDFCKSMIKVYVVEVHEETRKCVKTYNYINSRSTIVYREQLQFCSDYYLDERECHNDAEILKNETNRSKWKTKIDEIQERLTSSNNKDFAKCKRWKQYDRKMPNLIKIAMYAYLLNEKFMASDKHLIMQVILDLFGELNERRYFSSLLFILEQLWTDKKLNNDIVKTLVPDIIFNSLFTYAVFLIKAKNKRNCYILQKTAHIILIVLSNYVFLEMRLNRPKFALTQMTMKLAKLIMMVMKIMKLLVQIMKLLQHRQVF